MSDAVLSNRDMVRHLLSNSNGAVGVLSASKAIREGEECRSHYERWAREGCPSDASDRAVVECLHGIGGLDSRFCQGSFEVTTLEATWPVRIVMAAKDFAAHVLALLTPPRDPGNVLTVVSLTLGASSLTFRLGSQNTLSAATHEWRKKGPPCQLTLGQVRQLIEAVLTRTGKVEVPCSSASNVRSPLRVPRVMSIRITRRDEGQEWFLLSGHRRVQMGAD